MTFTRWPYGPLLGPALGGYWSNMPPGTDFLDYPGWHHRRYRHIMPDAELHQTMLDILGFIIAGDRNGRPDAGARRQKGLGIAAAALCWSPAADGDSFYLWHARDNVNALFSLNLFHNKTFARSWRQPAYR